MQKAKPKCYKMQMIKKKILKLKRQGLRWKVLMTYLNLRHEKQTKGEQGRIHHSKCDRSLIFSAKLHTLQFEFLLSLELLTANQRERLIPQWSKQVWLSGTQAKAQILYNSTNTLQSSQHCSPWLVLRRERESPSQQWTSATWTPTHAEALSRLGDPCFVFGTQQICPAQMPGCAE